MGGFLKIFGTFCAPVWASRVSSFQFLYIWYPQPAQSISGEGYKQISAFKQDTNFLVGRSIAFTPILALETNLRQQQLQQQAGSLCKDLGNENLAFVLLNRYVDLTEAIDEGNASLLDNSDFAEATNVPLVDDRTLPTKQVT